MMENASGNIVLKRVLSALFYATTSICIMLFNKSVLSNYNFPSYQFVGFGQMVASVIVLYLARAFKVVTFPEMDSTIPYRIFPIPLLFFGNLVTGLGGTKQLSLPMFTVLRRFTILITMVIEFFILNKRPTTSIVFSVFAMIAGAIIAASDDLAFQLIGYILIISNDLFTALYNVFVKKQLNSQDLGTYGIIYYCSLFMCIPSLILCYLSGDLTRVFHFAHWNNVFFVFQFSLSCIMGFILLWSLTLCNAFNSPLTTTVVGALKNVFITYFGMIFGGDYVYSNTNFIGINVSVVGGIIYSYVVFMAKQSDTSAAKSNKDAENKMQKV